MQAQFDAFTVDVVLSNFARKVDSLCVWGDTLLAGLNDGTLLFLKEPTKKGDQNQWQVLQAIKGFGRRAVTQIVVSASRSLLLSLSEEGVSLHTLPDVQLKCQANRSRLASCFAWDDDRSIMVVAVKRKVYLYHLNGMDLVDLKEFTPSEPILTVSFAGEHVIAAGRSRYYLLNTHTNAVTDILAVSRAPQPTILHLLSTQEVLLTRDATSIFLNYDGKPCRKIHITWSEPPLALTMADPYAIALLPSSIEVRSISRLSTHTIHQSIPLPHMTILAPAPHPDGSVFVAASSEAGIRRLHPIPWDVQARSLAAAGEFLEALDTCQLIPDTQSDLRRSLEDALRVRYGYQLFAQGEFDEGMAQFGLCSQADPLLLVGLFPSLVPPRYAAHLPSSVGGEPLPPAQEPTGPAYPTAVSMLLPYLLSHRTRLAASVAAASNASATTITAAAQSNGHSRVPAAAAEANSSETASETDAKVVPTILDTAIMKAMLASVDTGALLRFVQQDNSCDLEEGRTALTAAGRYAELAALYQNQHHHQEGLELLRMLSEDQGALPVPPTGAAAELGGPTGVWAAVRYLVTLGPTHLPLIQQHCPWILRADPEAFIEALLQMTPPLAPASSLALLAAHAPEFRAPYLETALEAGVARPQEFHSELLLIYLQAVLQEQHHQAASSAPRRRIILSDLLHHRPTRPLRLFPDPHPSSPSFRSRAPGHRRTASAASSTLSTSFSLSTPLNPFDDPNSAAVELQSLDSETTAAQPPIYQRLRELVYRSPHIQPEYVISKLPAGALPEIRALMLERLGRHREALRLYCHTLHDLKLAEEYCDRVYDALVAESKASSSRQAPGARSKLPLLEHPGDVYLELLQAVMEGPVEGGEEGGEGVVGGGLGRGGLQGGRVEGVDAAVHLSSETWGQVAWLMSRKVDRIDCLKVLSLVPGATRLAEVGPFLEATLAALHSQRRNLAVLKHLRRSENLQVHEDKVGAQQSRVLLTDDRACSICHKRIGGSVLVAHPNGQLSHYLCHRRHSGGGTLTPPHPGTSPPMYHL